MVAIVSVTAVLVSEPPARAEVAPRGPYATTARLGDLELNLVVDPAAAGRNQIHLYLTNPSGQPTDVDEASVSATLASRQIGPLRLQAHRAGPGHFIVHGAQLALRRRLAATRAGSPRRVRRSDGDGVGPDQKGTPLMKKTLTLLVLAGALIAVPAASCSRHRQPQRGSGGQLLPLRDPRPQRNRRRGYDEDLRRAARDSCLRRASSRSRAGNAPSRW